MSPSTSPAAPARRRWADIAERAAWTLLQAGVGVAVVEALDLPPAWAAVAALLLSVAKGVLASRYGDGSAATLPTELSLPAGYPLPPTYLPPRVPPREDPPPPERNS